MTSIDALTRLTTAVANRQDAANGPGILGDIAKGFAIPVLGDQQQGNVGSFQQTLVGAINEVSAAQDKATDYTAKFVRGENIDLHQVMAATDEAQISATMLLEVRNKVTDAYRSLINMQS